MKENWALYKESYNCRGKRNFEALKEDTQKEIIIGEEVGNVA
jgi:hypothetical protein